VQLPVHRKTICNQGFKVFANLFIGDDKVLQVPLDTHEKSLPPGVHMLGQVQDITAVPEDELGNRYHDPFLIRAMYQQNG